MLFVYTLFYVLKYLSCMLSFNKISFYSVSSVCKSILLVLPLDKHELNVNWTLWVMLCETLPADDLYTLNWVLLLWHRWIFRTESIYKASINLIDINQWYGCSDVLHHTGQMWRWYLNKIRILFEGFVPASVLSQVCLMVWYEEYNVMVMDTESLTTTSLFTFIETIQRKTIVKVSL